MLQSDIRVVQFDEAGRMFEMMCCSEYKANHLVEFFCDFRDVSTVAIFVVKRNTKLLFD